MKEGMPESSGDLRLIVLAGGIGTGKSVVSRILRLNGVSVYDCDSRAKELMEESEDFKLELCRRMGADMLDADGGIRRACVAEKVFADAGHLEWINTRVHSMVRDDIRGIVDAMHGRSLLVVESAIAATSGLLEMADALWIVDAPESLRMQRVMCRSGMQESGVLSRMAAQKEEERLMSGWNGTVEHIVNDGTRPLLPRVLGLIDRFRMTV